MQSRILVAAVALAVSCTASADEWQWSVTPYLWATDVGASVSVSGRELVDANVAFEDLLEDLKMVTQVRAEAMRGEHGIALDLFNVELATSDDRVPLPGGSGSEFVLDTSIGMTIFDLAGVYDRGGDRKGLSILYGTRIISQRNDIDAEIQIGGMPGPHATYDADDYFVDGLIGIRYGGSLTSHWSYQFAADVSTGGTELTWSIGPTIGYAFGDKNQYRLNAGYRHMVVDFDTPDMLDMDMTLSGFLAGFRFSF